MNKYEIYSTNDGVHAAIKIGWSWTNFFIVVFVYAIIMCAMEIFFSRFFVTAKEYIICMLVFGIVGSLFAILNGMKGNKITEQKLIMKKFCFRGIVSNKNEGMAIYNYITKANKNDNKYSKSIRTNKTKRVAIKDIQK